MIVIIIFNSRVSRSKILYYLTIRKWGRYLFKTWSWKAGWPLRLVLNFVFIFIGLFANIIFLLNQYSSSFAFCSYLAPIRLIIIKTLALSRLKYINKVRDNQKSSKIFYPYISIYFLKALLKTKLHVETKVHLDQFSPSYGRLKGECSVR